MGAVFGATLFAVAGEILVPLFGFSQPRKYSWTTHLYGLLSHIAYGVKVNGIRGTARGPLSCRVNQGPTQTSTPGSGPTFRAS